MKKCLLLAGAIIIIANTGMAQDEEEGQKGFKKENLFTGGSITLSFFNGQTLLGANPIFGYKIANWIDAGLSFNFLYSSIRYFYQPNDRLRQTLYGPGVFTRLYPISFLFVQGQVERNFITQKYTASSSSYSDGKYTTSASSLLLGAGYAQGRSEGSNSFYYISILFDVLKNRYSPYVNVINPDTPQQSIVMTPIIRAGVNIALFSRRER